MYLSTAMSDDEDPVPSDNPALLEALGLEPDVDPDGDDPDDPDELPPPKKPRYACAGSKRRDEDSGRKYCTYKAIHRWIGPCPGDPTRMYGNARLEAIAALAAGKGCSRYYDILTIQKKDHGSRKEQSMRAMKHLKMDPPIPTGIAEFDKVLGGGLVKGATLMFGGTPGSGKSSILLQAAMSLAKRGVKVFFASGEMTQKQNFNYALRLAGEDLSDEVLDRVRLVTDTDGIDIMETMDRVEAFKPEVFFLDSIQLSQHRETKASMGSADQVDAVTQYVSSYCQKKDVASIFISHLIKGAELDYKGANTAQHAVDGLLMLDRYDVLDENGGFLRGTFREDKSIVRQFFWKEKSRQCSDTLQSFMVVDEANRFGPIPDFVRMKMARLRSV